jgi:2-polyprenyl-3-methyl-5-hydroxy-6-metoxy-1,4-benzoquinol methylase
MSTNLRPASEESTRYLSQRSVTPVEYGELPSISVRLAECLMRAYQTQRPTWSNGAELNEIVKHPKFTQASESECAALLMRSAEAKYASENRYPWDHYFGMDLGPELTGKHVMDLGCLYGGRSVAWAEKYRLASITGIDVNPAYIDVANRFAKSKSIHADFHLAFGESLPFESESFDAILSFDVLEHVQSPVATLAECRRVLKPGGRLYLVFPSYWQPIEHHLSLVTHAPGLQYLFSGDTLVKAYNRILASRGEDAAWYKRADPELQPWERCNTINGTSLRRFRKMVKEGGWEVIRHSRPPIGSIGRTTVRKPRMWHRALAAIGKTFVHLPWFNEVFLHRIVFVLER